MIPLQALIDAAQCFETVRSLRWPDGVQGPKGESPELTSHGCDETPPAPQRSLGQSCARRVADVTHPILAGPHHPRRLWSLGLYFMGRHRSKAPIATELDRTNDDGHPMTSQ